jgi:PASTA domain
VLALLAQTTPTTDTTSQVTHLTGSVRWVTLALVVGFVLLAGVVVAVGRRVLMTRAVGRSGPGGSASDPPAEDATLVRSWLAISLVGGLLIFVALSFWIDDTSLRSALIGGLVANAGGAVAFYFASKSSDQARRDILSASLPMTLVPDLLGRTMSQVNEAIAATSLRIQATPASADPAAQVVSQQPPPNQACTPGAVVAVTLAGPVPDLSGLTLVDARSALTAVNLVLVPDPATAADDAKVKAQTVPKGGEVPTDRNVGVTFQ